MTKEADQTKIKNQLNALFEQLDEESIQELDGKSFNDAYKKLYKYGQIIEGSDNYLTFSFTNLTGSYQSKLLLTTIIGYQFRANDEWEVPDDVQVFPVYDYCRGLQNGINIVDDYYKKYKEITPKLQRDIEQTKAKMADRIAVRKFLEHLYQFDPDRHVRSAYRPQPKDKTRTIIETPAAKLAISCLKFKDAEFREQMLEHERNLQLMNMATNTSTDAAAKPYSVDFFNDLVDTEFNITAKTSKRFDDTDKNLYQVVQKLLNKYTDIDRINVEYLNSSMKIVDDTFQKINKSFGLSEVVLNSIREELQNSYEERLGILQRENKKAVSILSDIVASLHREYGTVDGKILTNTYNMIPPADTFHKINFYKEANYDKLIDAVKHLYCDTPELDMAIIPHNWHDTEEKARDYVKRHKNQAIAEVITARSGMWNFFAPYETVRDTTVFFNDKTIVLEEIIAQQKRDNMLAEDIMKKKMKRQKRKNIQDEGPEAEGFKEWRKQNGTLKSMGAIEVDPYEDDCPPDAIEIPVYRANAKEGTIEKSKFYSKAESPLFMKDNKNLNESLNKIKHT